MNKNIDYPASVIMSKITLAAFKIIIYTNTEKTPRKTTESKNKNKIT